MKTDAPHFLVVAGEASGDLHGAKLVQALLEIYPQAQFTGMGGTRMQKAGVKTLFGIERMGAVGLVEILADFGHYFGVYRALMKEIASRKYTAIILIDYPTLNLRLAKQGRRHDCPVYYFISPQVWAWRRGRIKDIRKSVKKMFVILPFEEEMYREEGVDAEFLGHPFIDMVHPTRTREESLEKYSLDPEKKIVGLLPGSRMNEVNSLLDEMLLAAEKIRKELDTCQFLLPIADSIDPDIIQQKLGSNPLDIKIVKGEAYDVMNTCDTLIIASGSATLEAGIIGCPMVIIYKLNQLTYWLALILINTPYYGLVNIVAREGVAPELIQSKANAENIAAESLKILQNDEHCKEVRDRLLRVRENLGNPGVMKSVAASMAGSLSKITSHEKISF
ncbi:MAG: lipid-A-disaccharide synthase [Nitrospina sp.]|jgi:lipid-A-disaccharide synthase|nr:lipid-A-disaccharide synthase [Nitrospina sp.]MBT6716652.1 lipid-A-disaccharide synthase [Nitrospina sp.]